MNWTEEMFQIVNLIPRTPVVYEVRDILERPIEGTIYEKVLTNRIRKKKKERRVYCAMVWIQF